jgi:hypothetical protein
MAAAPAFIATPKNPVVAFANADGTAFKTVMSAGALGSRLDALIGSNTDAAVATVMQLAIRKSSIDYVIGEVTIAAGAGTNGATASTALLNATNIPGLGTTENGGLYLETGCDLRARPKVAVAGVNGIQLIGLGGDY